MYARTCVVENAEEWGELDAVVAVYLLLFVVEQLSAVIVGGVPDVGCSRAGHKSGTGKGRDF